MGKFGWSLPPGCSMADIDRAFGDEPSALELFEMHGGLGEEEKALLPSLYDLSGGLYQIIDKAMSWAYEQGYQQHQEDEAEYRDHLEGQQVGEGSLR